MKSVIQTQTVFDHDHYRRLIESRGATIKNVLNTLQRVSGLKTALDAGCGLGFFAQILDEAGMAVRAFDGRDGNVEEAKRRFPEVEFFQADIEHQKITSLGQFDFVLCFGLLYHLENPFAAIRNLRGLTGKFLLLESMCLPEERPWMLLREELNLQDQSLTDVAFYASEGCLAKMLYRAGFSYVYCLEHLPDHDDFRDTSDHVRRRTVLLATFSELALPGFTLFPEPRGSADPWRREPRRMDVLGNRVRTFAKKPGQQKYLAVARRVRRVLPALPVPIRLPFGAWWLAEHSALDHELMSGGFEKAELEFVTGFLKPGMIVLDIGAHHGLYTLLSSKLVGPGGKVVAFEPSPRERKRLQRHLALNRIRNVTVESVAVGAVASEADLYLAEGADDWCNSLRRPAESVGRTVRVQVRTLADVSRELGLTKIDFIKLDVEGAELDALKGAEALFSGAHRPVILAEVYDIRTRPFGYEAREIVKFLSDLKYHWFALSESGSLEVISPDLASYDANLVAVPMEMVEQVFQSLGEERVSK